MFTVTLSGAAATAQVISYSLDGGTTVAGTVMIPAGELTETITVPTTPDGIFGSAAGPVTVTLAGGASDTIILTDAEAAPSVSIAGDAETVVEGQAAVFTVTLSGAAATAQVISYSLDGGTTVAGTVTIPAGELTETITVPTTPDGIFGSAAGRVTVTLAGGASDTIILTDAEAAPSARSPATPRRLSRGKPRCSP